MQWLAAAIAAACYWYAAKVREQVEVVTRKELANRPAMLDVLEYRVIDTGFPSLEGYWWLYVPFNIGEGLLWLCIAGFVLFRWARRRRTWLEVLYAMSFVLFGLTDFIEVIATPLWLLALKGCCLLAILLGRKLVIGHYPGAKL